MKIFVFALAIAVGIIIFNFCSTTKINTSLDFHRSIDSHANPFRTRIFVLIHCTDASKAADQIENIFLTAEYPRLTTVGVIQTLSKNISETPTNNIISLLRQKNLHHLDSNIRISLTKNTNKYSCLQKGIEELLTDEIFVLTVDENVTLPKKWDRMALDLFETSDGQNYVFSATNSGDFPVCTGNLHGIPHFETRNISFNHENLAFPIITIFPEFFLMKAHQARKVFSENGVYDTVVPEWAIPAIVSSACHDQNYNIITLHRFKVYKFENKKEKENFSPNLLKSKISSAYLQYIQWDFEIDEPGPLTRLGLSIDSTPLERRIKWGDESHQDHAMKIASGEY